MGAGSKQIVGSKPSGSPRAPTLRTADPLISIETVEAPPRSALGAMLSFAAGPTLSAVVHAAMLLALALIPTFRSTDFDEDPLVLAAIDNEQPIEIDDLPNIIAALRAETIEPVDLVETVPELHPETPEVHPQMADNVESGADAAPPPLEDRSAALLTHRNRDIQIIGQGSGENAQPGNGRGAFGLGRGMGFRGSRRAKAKSLGATKASEEAVDAALLWLAAHQLADGSWNFDHRGGECKGRCDHHGNASSATAAATAMALLPFLGAGHTHVEGKHQRTVAKGLYFLIGKIKPKGSIGSFWEPRARMYSQGLATLALCEATAMTLPDDQQKKRRIENPLFSNKRLAMTAQMGLNYIMDTQGPRGGWRYDPGERGDTSVVGWQLMALKSGYLAGLKVEPRTIAGLKNFLDSVQSERGADYGYISRTKGTIATRAIGLLSRMYLGWPRQHPGLAAGAKHLAKVKPQRTDIYFNYYATQVLSHYGGPLWQTWNVEMRDTLVRSQSRRGHSQGSWYFADPHGSQMGGRLYSTAMAAMTLEVYYRILPIYRKRSVERDPQ
ncbi:MAG: hypothetical protein IID44_28605 [Planctomycetes bacterium]|nr:hypothetical protein [Planctomycetota bacterium]